MIIGFHLLALGIIYYRQPKYLALGKKKAKEEPGARTNGAAVSNKQ
jgi:hypothetical protein